MILITGGSGSGKSEYAESIATGFSGIPLLYVATMAKNGREAKERIIRHRKLRDGKGFDTLESMYLEERMDVFKGKVVLLEDLSNLLSNYMFNRELAGDSEETVDIIYGKLRTLNNCAKELIIVTNEIFSDGITYEKSVMQYIHSLAALNQKLASISSEFIEVVYGIPVPVK